MVWDIMGNMDHGKHVIRIGRADKRIGIALARTSLIALIVTT